MKQLKQKVIQLGIKRGYLPHDALQDSEVFFETQYLRLQEEIGELSREVRIGNYEQYLMELGDCIVLHTNCYYIAETFLNIKDYYPMLDNARDGIDILNRLAQGKFVQRYDNHIRDKKALELAYNKILDRGGILINGDFFKPTDPEYIKYMQVNLGDYVNHNNEV